MYDVKNGELLKQLSAACLDRGLTVETDKKSAETLGQEPANTVSRDARAIELDQAIEREIQLLNDIADKARVNLESAEEHLYLRLRETYVLYYRWMSSPNKTEYIEALETYLDQRHIPYNAGTSEALKMTKAVLGEENKSKASKYAKHMDTAYRKGITSDEYPNWMKDNGVEAISRKRSRIKHAKKIPIDDRSDFQRALMLIQKWLDIREAMPIASAVVDNEKTTSYETLRDQKYTNTRYELAICSRNKAGNNQEIINTLWLLPKTVAIEKIFMHQLAHAIYKDLDNLEEKMQSDELTVLGNEIDQLMAEEEIYQFAYQDDELELRHKINEALSKGLDESSVYAEHKFVKPKIKRPMKS